MAENQEHANLISEIYELHDLFDLLPKSLRESWIEEENFEDGTGTMGVRNYPLQIFWDDCGTVVAGYWIGLFSRQSAWVLLSVRNSELIQALAKLLIQVRQYKAKRGAL